MCVCVSMSVRVCASCFLKLARTERINNTQAINGLFSLAEQRDFLECLSKPGSGGG